MFLQLLNMRYAWTDEDGVSRHLSNVGGGANLDNGLGVTDLPIGMTLDSPPDFRGSAGWWLPDQSALTVTQTHDPPQWPVSIGSQFTTVNTMSFNTYLYVPAKWRGVDRPRGA
ncbi:MAG: hypothetical protein IRY99_25465 [Isosphaeraceae bacterium]|nr:hypothetical protein [Isosphaeraceae bacterium]